MVKQTTKSYNKQAEKYEHRWEKYLEHTHRVLLEEIDVAPDDVILDPSGGTGLLAQKLISQGFSFKQLVLNDPSNQMLAIARNRLSEHSYITFSNMQVQELSYPPNHFDSIVCLNAFHLYKGQQQVLNQFYQILVPGGNLYLLDWNREGFFRIIDQIIRWSTSEYIDTRSLSELRKMMIEGGFELQKTNSWNWRYWKFLFVEAGKIK